MPWHVIKHFLKKFLELLHGFIYDVSMNKHLLYGYRLIISSIEYSLVLIPVYVHAVMLIAYIQVGGSLLDLWVLFASSHVLLPSIMYLYLLHKCKNGLSISFMLRFRGFPAVFSLIIFLIYSISLSTLVLFLDVTSAIKFYTRNYPSVGIEGLDVEAFESQYLSKALSLIGARVNESGLLYSAVIQLVKGRYFEIYLGLLGTVLAVLLILLYSSSEFLSGELDLYVHRHSLRNIIDLFRRSKNKIVISGYGFLGKALVKGLFEHIMSTYFHKGIETGYVYVWDHKSNSLKLESVASNVLIISRDSEEWDYRIEHPVYKNIGAEEVEYSLGQKNLVLVLGPNIRSDFLLKQSGSYDAKVFSHTFRSKAIESFLYTKLHQLQIPEFTGTLVIRSTTSSSLVSLTMRDLTSKLHRYYPEYVFANLLLRRLYALLLKIINRGKKPLIIAMGRGKTIYYILESIRILSMNYNELEEIIYHELYPNIADVSNIMDIIMITNDETTIPRSTPFKEFIETYNLNLDSANSESLNVINNSVMLRESARIYVTSLRYVARGEPNNMIVPLIFSKPDSFSVIFEVVSKIQYINNNSNNMEIVPVFIITSNIEGENIHSLIELLRVWRTIENNKGVNADFYAIVSLLHANEYSQVLELAYLYGYIKNVRVVNVYKTVKESLCSFISSIMVGGY